MFGHFYVLIFSAFSTLVSLDEAHSVDIPSENDLLINLLSINSVSWDQNGLLPFTISASSTVDIVMILLNPFGEWVNFATLGTGVPNMGRFSIPSENIIHLLQELNRLCPDGSVCPVVIGVQIDIIPEISSLDRLSQSDIWISLWSGVYYSFVIKSNFSGHCDNWEERQLTMEEALNSLNELPPCPPTRSRAEAVNSGFVKQELSSLVGVTSYSTQWMEFFHPGVESCFKQSRLNSLLYLQYAKDMYLACPYFPKYTLTSDL